MKQSIDLNEITIFIKVIETGSFIGASRSLKIPKTTISRKIARLEKNLGVQLLQRTTRQVNPTEAGKIYFDRCIKIIQDIEEANQTISTGKFIPNGTLKIAAFNMLGMTIINSWLIEFLNYYRQINVEILLTNHYIDLEQEGIDIYFRTIPFRDPGIINRKILNTSYWVCASPEYLFTYGEPIAPQDLSQHFCISNTSGNLSKVMQWNFYRQGQEEIILIPSRIKVNDVFYIKQSVVNGLGIACLPNIIIMDEIRSGRLIRLLKNWSLRDREIYLAYCQDRYLSPKVKLFIDFIQEKIFKL